MTDNWIQYRAETCQRGNICVLHMVLLTDLGHLALAMEFHVEGFQPFLPVVLAQVSQDESLIN